MNVRKKNNQELVFSSKANVLQSLQSNLKKSKIEKLLYFTISEWREDEVEILRKIRKNFLSRIIIRSSAIGEDGLEKSEAGKFLSILNINPNSKTKLKNAIESVIASYGKNLNLKNQVLIQSQSKNVLTSGVLFTRTPDLGSPYYVLNYQEGNRTDAITKGEIGNTIKIFRGINHRRVPRKWRKLMESIQEIEKTVHSNFLDIEFAITKYKIIIFQVRPLTTGKHLDTYNLDLKIEKIIGENKAKIKKEYKKSNETITIFSDMADWNPAEIIGNTPNNLDYSLYDFVIMNNSWSKSRHVLGYQKKSGSLMKRFGNKPYVNVNASFNSLIPKKFSKKISKELLDYFLIKLKNNPELHDKVEFDILFTCYDLTLKNRLLELEKAGFSKKDIKNILNVLNEFTNKLINKFPSISMQSNNSIEKMNNNRDKLLIQLHKSKNTYAEYFETARKLLVDCRDLGAIPFSSMARLAFISSILMRGLKDDSNLTSDSINDFLTSIQTVLSEFKQDVINLSRNRLTTKVFLKKYGHLRPGTYDITIPRYENNQTIFHKINFQHETKKKKFEFDESKIKRVLKQHKLKFEKINFIEFVQQTLIQREKLKFEFTKNLSQAIELIAMGSKKLDFSREEISNLSLSDIFKFNKYPKKKFRKYLQKKIFCNYKIKKLSSYLSLPSIIFSEDDFEIIQYHTTVPNYITKNVITEDVIFINSYRDIPNIDNKIVVIENADPGFDWIFTKNPKGLITKYGGIASHMAIRCGEIDMPAVVGCGEILFEKLKIAKRISIDCKNEKINVIEYSKKDDYLEEKKLLKALGYIK